MTFMIFGYKVVDKTRIVIPPYVLEKWPNNHDFGFDISVPEIWYKYIKRKKYHLRKTKDELPFVFQVTRWGNGVEINGCKKTMSLFPGRNPDGTKRKMVVWGLIK